MKCVTTKEPAAGAADAFRATTTSFKQMVARSLDAIRDASTKGRVGVSFSGGKDSLVTLDLVRSVVPDAPAALFDSGCEMPETLEMCERYNVDVIQPRYTYPEMARYSGWFGCSEAVDPGCKFPVKHILIEEPAESFVVKQRLMVQAIGLRCQESSARDVNARVRGMLYQRKDRTWCLMPVAFWTHDDIWAYIASRKLYYHPAYDRMQHIGIPRGEQRLGASLGTINIEGGRFATMKRIAPQHFARLAAMFPQLRDMT
jgi:3'-phosphoadenosine 5'-phosphosulfate sulfotransferase (PAPS reductase)/FAD synthetase